MAAACKTGKKKLRQTNRLLNDGEPVPQEFDHGCNSEAIENDFVGIAYDYDFYSSIDTTVVERTRLCLAPSLMNYDQDLADRLERAKQNFQRNG